jgi:hypothetical protein
MSIVPGFRFSEDAARLEPGTPFGLVAARGVSTEALGAVVGNQKVLALEQIKDRANDIRQQISAFDSHFKEYGFDCPLPGQFNMTEKRGFPEISPFVDALLICEMTKGVLMGIQDLGTVAGQLVYDVAEDGETFRGFRGTIRCSAGEIVLRDEEDIVASYFQGPDKRTSVKGSTKSLLFYVFSAPQLVRSRFDDAMIAAAEIVGPAAEDVEMEVFES